MLNENMKENVTAEKTWLNEQMGDIFDESSFLVSDETDFSASKASKGLICSFLT